MINVKNARIHLSNKNDIETEALKMIQEIVEIIPDVNISIMPDVHVGKGIVVGFTSEFPRVLSPEWVGVDIGCGMASRVYEHYDFKPDVLDKKIQEVIPMGSNLHDRNIKLSLNFKRLNQNIKEITEKFNAKFNTEFNPPVVDNKYILNLASKVGCNTDTLHNSLGTLGGGNHFIEFGKSSASQNIWCTVHSGSRNFGLRICMYHVKKGDVNDIERQYQVKRAQILDGPAHLRETKLRALSQKYEQRLKESRNSLLHTPERLYEYLIDMMIAQEYAMSNRVHMLDLINKTMGVNHTIEVHSVHNYISPRDLIIRKGAISSHKNEIGIIPMNMRDGILITRGTGNAQWNYSAPHGAGRIMSRTKAKEKLSLEEFQKKMRGVYSSCISEDTLDESPMAYKDPSLIRKEIVDTARITNVIKPILNIKGI